MLPHFSRVLFHPFSRSECYKMYTDCDVSPSSFLLLRQRLPSYHRRTLLQPAPQRTEINCIVPISVIICIYREIMDREIEEEEVRKKKGSSAAIESVRLCSLIAMSHTWGSCIMWSRPLHHLNVTQKGDARNSFFYFFIFGTPPPMLMTYWLPSLLVH